MTPRSFMVSLYKLLPAFCSLLTVRLLQGYDGEPPILLKEEPEDGPRSFQKVPSLLSDLSDDSMSKYQFLMILLIARLYYKLKILLNVKANGYYT